MGKCQANIDEDPEKGQKLGNFSLKIRMNPFSCKASFMKSGELSMLIIFIRNRLFLNFQYFRIGKIANSEHSVTILGTKTRSRTLLATITRGDLSAGILFKVGHLCLIVLKLKQCPG